MDGGIRSGTDIFKAIALGAKAVFIGRPVVYGLAVGVRVYQSYGYSRIYLIFNFQGKDGVKRVLGLLRTEFENAMKLSGEEYIMYPFYSTHFSYRLRNIEPATGEPDDCA